MPSNFVAIKSLDTIMDGAVNERFVEEWQRLLQNVFDPNTDPVAKRSVTINIEVQPSDDRSAGTFKLKVSSKLAPPIVVTKPLFLSRDDNGNVTAQERSNQLPGQMNMQGTEFESNVVTFSHN